MLKNSPNIGTGTITLKDDPRVLPFGKFLRKTKINELPQIWNILKGDMSLIGPRPLDKRCYRGISKKDQDNIKKIKPGLSGVGSIFFRDEESMLEKANTKNKEEFYDKVISPYKGKLETWYYKNRNIYTYFMLIFLTVWAVMKSDTKLHFRVLKDLPIPPQELK